MYKLLDIDKAEDGKHKYKVVLLNTETNRKKTVKFGSYGMMDYVLWNEKEGKQYADERKKLYIERHQNNENWNDPSTSGFWSRWVLWNKKTFKASLNDTIKKFKL
jgi:hypothetical protein